MPGRHVVRIRAPNVFQHIGHIAGNTLRTHSCVLSKRATVRSDSLPITDYYKRSRTFPSLLPSARTLRLSRCAIRDGIAQACVGRRNREREAAHEEKRVPDASHEDGDDQQRQRMNARGECEQQHRYGCRATAGTNWSVTTRAFEKKVGHAPDNREDRRVARVPGAHARRRSSRARRSSTTSERSHAPRFRTARGCEHLRASIRRRRARCRPLPSARRRRRGTRRRPRYRQAARRV
ncbi:hypothetical protein OKW29_004531 [Paraburkholderia sp. CI3]